MSVPCGCAPLPIPVATPGAPVDCPEHREQQPVPTEWFTALEEDWWRCECGNEPDGWGHAPGTRDGKLLPMAASHDGGDWDSDTLVCMECGRFARMSERDPVSGLVPVRGRGPAPTDEERHAASCMG